MPLSKNEKLLFILDLDGTTLADSSTLKINPITQKAIKRAIETGHIVCLATGRPWRSSKAVYNSLGLDSIISNHNGSHIHNPNDENFIPLVKYMALNELMYIMGDTKLKKAVSNYAIQGIDWVQLHHSDPQLEDLFGFNQISKFKLGINLHKLPLKPLGAIIDVNEKTDVLQLGDFLKRRYGDLAEFSSWPKSENSYVFEISPLGVSKSKTLSFLSRYYHIPNKNIVAIGDGWNDITMFKVAGLSVAMVNAIDHVKECANYVTTKCNKDGGVGIFMNKLLNAKTINNFRKTHGKGKVFTIKTILSGTYH